MVAPKNQVTPLNINFPIVTDKGLPSAAFIQAWNRVAKVSGGIPSLDTPAEVSAVLDVLSAVRPSLLMRGASQWGPIDAVAGSLLLRGATDWGGLASPSDITKFLSGANPPAWSFVHDADLSVSDVLTNNVSTAKHGFTPKLPNDATKFLNGVGGYTAPSGTTAAMVKLAEVTTAAAATSVSFPSIPSGYRDLMLRWTAKSAANANDTGLLLNFNTDTGANYDRVQLFVGAATSVVRNNGQTGFGGPQIVGSASGINAAMFDSGQLNIGNYTSAFYKALYGQSSDNESASNLNVRDMNFAGRWRNTAAMTQIDATLSGGVAFVNGSIFSLYGIT